jgi:hypothetical protein
MNDGKHNKAITKKNVCFMASVNPTSETLEKWAEHLPVVGVLAQRHQQLFLHLRSHFDYAQICCHPEFAEGFLFKKLKFYVGRDAR